MDHHLNEEYAAATLLERHQLPPEEKQALRKSMRARFLIILLGIVCIFCMSEYKEWRDYDRFTPPAEVLTESEFRELVEGYPQLAEALGGTYGSSDVCVTRGKLEYVLDVDAMDDVRVDFELYGNLTAGYVLREPKELTYSGWRQHYGLSALFKGRAFATSEEVLAISDHTAEIVIRVTDPGKDFAEARAEIEKLLAIVRAGTAD